jgi:hypothetical protein
VEAHGIGKKYGLKAVGPEPHEAYARAVTSQIETISSEKKDRNYLIIPRNIVGF